MIGSDSPPLFFFKDSKSQQMLAFFHWILAPEKNACFLRDALVHQQANEIMFVHVLVCMHVHKHCAGAGGCVCTFMRACVRARVHMRVRVRCVSFCLCVNCVCVRVCERERQVSAVCGQWK